MFKEDELPTSAGLRQMRRSAEDKTRAVGPSTEASRIQAS